MEWILRRKITKRGEMQMRKKKDKSLEILLTCKTSKKDAYEWINQWKDDHIIDENILSIYDCDKKEKIKFSSKAIDNNKLVEILKKDNFIFW